MGGTLPIAVQNLRRIWEKRKKSLEINQSQAAETLGWTQGAFSQYLNNITELHDEAVAKLANFLEVDPHEIDPEYQPIEAQLVRVPVRYVHGKTAAPSTKIMYRRRVPISVQKTNFHATCAIELAKDLRPLGYKGQQILCCDLFMLDKPNFIQGRMPDWYIVKNKNDNVLSAVRVEDCPPDDQLDEKFLPVLTYLVN